jgi:hypothetical protein
MMLKKAIWLCLLVLLAFAGKAQTQAYGGGADDNDLSFGFSFQYIMQNYKIVKKPDWQKPIFDTEEPFRQLTTPVTSISSATSPGFTVGFITRYRLSEFLEVRTTPALVFADRELNYTFEKQAGNNSQIISDAVDRQIQTTIVDIPLLLKLRSERVNNFRGYLVGGAKYSIALSKGQPDPNEAPLQRKIQNKRAFASYEVGIGCDIYFEYFKMSPEIKVGNSFGNILVANNVPLISPLSKLFLHSIMFSLHFE